MPSPTGGLTSLSLWSTTPQYGKTNPATNRPWTPQEIQDYNAKYGGQFSLGGGAKGAAGGAATGGMVGGIPGAIIGGTAGFFLGGYGEGAQNRANQASQESVSNAMAQQEQLRQEQLAMRKQDLAKAMAMFAPAQQFYSHLYGIPMDAWGPQGGGMPMPGAQGGGYTMTPQAKQGAANARAAMQPKDLPPVAMDPISADQVQRLKSMFAGQKRGY